MENSKIKILLIEDSVDDAELIQRKLEKSPGARFEVVLAKKLQDGLEQLAKDTPDLILSDLGLPDSHGLDTVTKILLEVPRIPLVVLSGFDDEAIAIKAVQAGAQDYLVKGQLESAQLERSLYYSIERARLQVELEQNTQEILNIQANLHKILEKNADAIIVVGQDKRVLFTNPAGESLLGRKRKELLNHQFDHKLITGKTSEIVITRPDREKHIAEMSVVEIRWEGSPAYLASLHDITKRKQMEEDLRASEGKYRNIVELAQDSIVISSPLGTITSCNKAFLNLIGFSEEEVVGKNFTELPSVHTIKNPEYLKLFTSILSGNVTRPIEMVWQRRDGTTRISELRASVMKSNDKITGIQALVIDITERKKAEETLRESEEKFSAAFRSSPDIIAIVNMKRGTYVEVNDSYTRATGYTRKEMIGRPVNEIDMWVKPEESEKMTRLIQEQGKITNEEFTFRMKSGEIRQWLCSAEMINIGGDPCVMSVATDITERKQMEKAIRESEEKFSKAFQSSANSFAICRLDNGNFMEVNEAFIRMMGYTREEFIGHNATTLNFWVDEEEHDRITKKTREHKTVRNEQIKTRCKSGEIRFGLFSSEQITIGGEPCFINTITDITELKRAEESVRVSEEKFSKAFLRSPEVIIISNIEDGTIFEANDTFLRLTGYNREEVVGKKTHELGIWAVPEQRAETINTLKETGKVSNKECLFRMKSGELRTWIFSAEIINIDKKPRMLSVTTDITERKKAEEELRFSDTALKSIHEGVFALDNEFKITRWNEMCEQMFAIKASEAIGKSAADVINMVEDYPGQNEKRINLLLEKGFNKEEQIYRTPRGDIWVDVQAQAMEENGQRYGWITLLSDISERKKTEEKLRESEERYRDLFENASDLIQSCTMEGKCIYVNKAWRDALGYSEKEVLNIIFWNIVHPDYLVHCKQAFQRVISGETVNNIQTAFVGKNGRLIQVEGNVNPVCKEEKVVAIRAIFRDITERKEAEEKLLESEERYRDLFENANDLIQSVALDGHFMYVNTAWREALGYTEKEVEKLIIWDIVHPDYVEHCKEVFQKVTTCETVFIETAFIAKNKKVIFVEGNANCYSHEGKIIATRGIFRDVTERKLADEKIRRIDEMKSEFLSNISHELRTPLQSISGFTKLIMNGQVPDPATQQEFFQIIDRETMHLGNLINGLLDMSRLEAGRFQINKKLVPIRDTFIDPIKMFHSLAHDKNITLSEDIPREIPEMEVDNERMRQVVINLVGNAIKFSDPGSSVAIKVEKQPGDLLFQVSDHGTGIREKDMMHLFERFYRAEGETVRGGTGLGLYISKQIVDAHGGRIWAESKFGEGSTFSFTLPLNGKGGNGNGKKNSGH